MRPPWPRFDHRQAAPIGIGTTSAAPSSDDANGAESSGSHDYVVVYDTAVDAAVARESIAAAGGTIVDEYSFGVARVAADQGFERAARQLPGILGVARNQSIGGSQAGHAAQVLRGAAVEHR